MVRSNLIHQLHNTMKYLILLIAIVNLSMAADRQTDRRQSWMYTTFQPYTLEHGPTVLVPEPNNTHTIDSRQSWVFQTFDEVSTMSDYYSQSDIEIKVGGSIFDFSGGYSRSQIHTFNTSTLTSHRMYIGKATEMTEYIVVDPRLGKFTPEWVQRMTDFANILDKVPNLCPGFDLMKSFSQYKQNLTVLLPSCPALRAAVNMANEMVNKAAWIVTGVKLGGTATVRVTVDAKSVSTMTEDQIRQGVSASYASFFSGSYSRSSTTETQTAVAQAITDISMSLIGGEGAYSGTVTNFSQWQRTVTDKPAVFGVDLERISKLVTPDRLPHVNPATLMSMQILLNTQTDLLEDMNTPPGCVKFNDEHFDPNAMKSQSCVYDGTVIFGGFSQAGVSLKDNDPQATCTVFNADNGQTQCPVGFHPVPILESGFIVPEQYNEPNYNQCWHSDGGWFSSGHTICPCRFNVHWSACQWYEVQYSCHLTPAICVPTDNASTPRSYNRISGGLYSSQENNPNTGAQNCPVGFDDIPVLNGFIHSCEAFAGTPNDKSAVPFGGLIVGNNPNALTKKGCPHGYKRYYLGSFMSTPIYQCLAGIFPQYTPPKWRDLPVTLYTNGYTITTSDGEKIRLTDSQTTSAATPASTHAIIGLSVSTTILFVTVLIGGILVAIGFLGGAITFNSKKFVRTVSTTIPNLVGGGYHEIGEDTPLVKTGEV